MAAVFGSPPFLSHPPTRILNFSSSSSSQTPPPQTPPPSQQPVEPISSKIEQQQQQQRQKPSSSSKAAASTSKVESTDWIASNLTRRFGLGAGLAWAGFLAFGVISEQIKTRLEVSQQEANTRF